MASTGSTLKPSEVTVALINQAVTKHRTRYDKTFVKAFMAGVMLSFGGLLDVIISGGSPGIAASNPGLVKVMGGFVFPVGLVMIVLQGFDLLTSNLMTFPMAVIKGALPWWSIPVNWIIVTFGNLTGSLFFAAILSKYTGLVTDAPYNTYMQSFAITKAVTPQFHEVFLRGIGCNWLVCVAVWQATGAAETYSKVIAIWIPIWVFVACGFDHVVANMFSLPLSIMLHADLTTAEYIRRSLVPSYIGNIVGGLLVGLPAVYFYLGDYEAGGLRAAEEAKVEKAASTSSDNGKE